MRLGDLDALRAEFAALDRPGMTIEVKAVLAMLDAAPAVSCGECEYPRIHSAGKPHEYRLCRLGVAGGYGEDLPVGFSCTRFDPRVDGES
jgi:hypothetical protein